MRQLLLAWTVDVDPQETLEIYSRIEAGAARGCGCGACRNYDAARPVHFPEPFVRLLGALEIDPVKEGAVHLVAPLERGRHLYAGTYGFCGEILAGRPFRGFPLAREEVDVFEHVASEAHVALRPWASPPVPWSEGRCVRLEFLVVLPWVLDAAGTPHIDLSRGSGGLAT